MDQKQFELFFSKKEYRLMRQINEKSSGLILCGIMIGILLSYSNFLGFTVGLISGITLSNRYEYCSSIIFSKCSDIFSYVLQLKKDFDNPSEEDFKVVSPTI